MTLFEISSHVLKNKSIHTDKIIIYMLGISLTLFVTGVFTKATHKTC